MCDFQIRPIGNSRCIDHVDNLELCLCPAEWCGSKRHREYDGDDKPAVANSSEGSAADAATTAANGAATSANAAATAANAAATAANAAATSAGAAATSCEGGRITRATDKRST